MVEIWKIIEGYPNYEVSNIGNIRSYKTTRGISQTPHLLSPGINRHGYKYVILTGGSCSSKKSLTIHRLVAKSFISNPNNYKCVNHKDKNKANNRIENLEWCTYSYNNNFDDANIRRSQTLINKHHLCKPVLQLNSSGSLLNEYPSVSNAAKVIGGTKSGISEVCNGLKPSYKGFIWVFKNI